MSECYKTYKNRTTINSTAQIFTYRYKGFVKYQGNWSLHQTSAFFTNIFTPWEKSHPPLPPLSFSTLLHLPCLSSTENKLSLFVPSRVVGSYKVLLTGLHCLHLFLRLPCTVTKYKDSKNTCWYCHLARVSLVNLWVYSVVKTNLLCVYRRFIHTIVLY